LTAHPTCPPPAPSPRRLPASSFDRSSESFAAHAPRARGAARAPKLRRKPKANKEIVSHVQIERHQDPPKPEGRFRRRVSGQSSLPVFRKGRRRRGVPGGRRALQGHG